MFDILPNWHPVFVHFTVGLIFTALILLVWARLSGDSARGDELRVAGRWTIRLAALFTLATLAAGFHAFLTVGHDDPSHIAMLAHRNVAIAASLGIFGLGFWSWRAGGSIETSSKFMALLAATALLVGVTAYKGSQLVFRHGLGVQSLPAISGEGHEHAPGEEHDGEGEVEEAEEDHTHAEGEEHNR